MKGIETMYLQITEKCNMHCSHCCYSCDMKGKHGDYQTIINAINFASEYYGDESISIGGGEPTLHPRFFDILRHCLETFDYVWLASNGSQTDTMFRLANIIDGVDFIDDYECDCDPDDLEDEDYECDCWMNAQDNAIYQEDKLSVALSQDCFHDPIDERIVDLWTKRANVHRHSNFEIRDVTRSKNGVIAQGRAAETGSGWNTDDCVCSDIIIKINGDLKLCGCDNAPVIGNIWDGIDEKWEKVLDDDTFQDANCYNYYLRETKKAA
jgi:organic radical activating enzyme